MTTRQNGTEYHISDLGDHISDWNHSIRRAKRKTSLRNENSLWDLWNNNKHNNIYIIWVSEGETEKRLKMYLRKWKLPKLEKGNTYPGTKSMCMHASSLQSGPTLCDPMDYSPPVFSVHGILQARILEWVAMPSFRGSSQPRDETCISYISCIDRQVLYY